MSDEEPDFEKTQIYLPPGKGEAPRPLPSKTNHEALLKPGREPAARSGVKVDFDITGDRAAAPKAAPATRPAPAAAAPASRSNAGIIAIVVALAVGIAAYLLLR